MTLPCSSTMFRLPEESRNSLGIDMVTKAQTGVVRAAILLKGAQVLGKRLLRSSVMSQRWSFWAFCDGLKYKRYFTAMTLKGHRHP